MSLTFLGIIGISLVTYSMRTNPKNSARRVGRGTQRVMEEDLAQEEIRNQGQALFDKGFDKKFKEKSVIALVDRAAQYLMNNPLEQACTSFTFNKEFVEGEVYLFVLDTKGVFLAHGEQSGMLWENRYESKDALGYPYIKEMIKKGIEGGGWVSYSWRNSIKLSYVKPVKKDNQTYIVGAGYYPHTKADIAVDLVKGACNYFNESIAQGNPPSEAFSTLSYPLQNRFIIGDLYLYALDFKGNIMAQGERPGLIGTNSLDYKDANGTLTNQEIIAKLEKQPEGIWVDYISKRAQKRAYAQKITDAQGNHYFIACGYYIDADRKSAEDLVGKAYQYMEAQGKGQGVRAITDKRDDAFRFGDLYIVVYDTKGLVIAHGGNEELLGKNAYDEKDEDGRFYVRELIDKALKGGGWVDYKVKNSFQSTYVETVDLGSERFVIACGLYPISKRETMMLLAKSAIGYFKSVDTKTALRAFVEPNGKFIRGDLGIFVFDLKGICYAWADNYKYVWKNLSTWQDDTGRFFIKDFIDTVQFGEGKVAYTLHNRQAIATVELVEKDGNQFIIGSSFYY